MCILAARSCQGVWEFAHFEQGLARLELVHPENLSQVPWSTSAFCCAGTELTGAHFACLGSALGWWGYLQGWIFLVLLHRSLKWSICCALPYKKEPSNKTLKAPVQNPYVRPAWVVVCLSPCLLKEFLNFLAVATLPQLPCSSPCFALPVGFVGLISAISSYTVQAIFRTWIQRFGSGLRGSSASLPLCRTALMLFPTPWTTPYGRQQKTLMVWNPRAGPFPWNDVFRALKATYSAHPLRTFPSGGGRRSLCWPTSKHQQL